MQQEEPAQKVKTKCSLQKSEENESSLKRCWELVVDELKRNTDGNVVIQQKDESSFAPEQDSSQTNQSDADAIHKECGVFAEELLQSCKLLKTDQNTAAQRTDEAPDCILLTLDQDSIQVTPQEDNVTHQNCDRNESLEPKLEQIFTEELKKSSFATMEDPIQTDELETNDWMQQERDRTSENGHFQDGESDQGSEKSHHVCFLTRQLEEEASPPLLSRICYHRTCTQYHRLPPVSEVPEEPLEEFEVDSSVRRNRTLGVRPPTVPTGIRDHMQRVSEHHIPPERRYVCEEWQNRILKLLCAIVISAFFYVMRVLLVNFLEKKYSNHGDSTSSGDLNDLDIRTTDFNPRNDVELASPL